MFPMSRILHRLPFHDGHTSVGIEGSVYRVLPLQIIVWVSLGPQGSMTWTRAPLASRQLLILLSQTAFSFTRNTLAGLPDCVRNTYDRWASACALTTE